MDNGTTIHLLIAVESSHDAEVVGSTLRNAGYAVRPTHVSKAGQLESSLKEQNWDLVVATPKFDNIESTNILEIIHNTGKDIPCIIYCCDEDRSGTLAILQQGAAGVVPSNEEQYFLYVVKTELNNLFERRSHRECRIQLTENEKRNRSLTDSSREPIAYIHEGMHIYANLSYVEIFGYTDSEEFESVPIMDLIASDNQQSFKQLLRSLSKGETPDKDFEFTAVRSNEEQFSAQMSFTPATIDGETCTQILIRQQSSNAALEKELDQLRKQDLLTGLFNRQHFMEELANAVKLATNDHSSSVLFYIEPDNFKTIKDTLGIAGSDIVLTDIANLLKDTLPGNVTLARFAGTIFTALFYNTTIDDVMLMSDQVMESFAEKLFEVEGKTVSTGCSIGITQISETTTDAKKALSNADAASILAKEKKDKKIHIHTVADEIATVEQDKAWADKISYALEHNRFILHFQPIVSLHAEPGERYEVLIRMLDKDDTIIMPAEFMEAAEHSDLSVEIDRWVMKNAAKALLEKRRDGVEIRFFIKLSYDSLTDATLLSWISKLLKAARLHGSSMVFELSEAIAANNIKSTKQLVSGLTQLNCLFAVDHVGNESDTLSYLSHFHAHYLKIDGQHIQNITSSETNQLLVKTVTEIARSKDILTIAEHVQDPACLAVLWQHGVNFIQGYYLQEPEDTLNYDFTSES